MPETLTPALSHPMGERGASSVISAVERLLIVSHVPHYEYGGKLFAYGPYVREIDIWADLFANVILAVPLRYDQPPGDAISFARTNISICPQLETGGDGFTSKLIQLPALAVHVWKLLNAMRRADAIQVRCPGNLGLLGCLLAPIFRKPRVAKYAGQWNDYEGEPKTWKWQKTLLRTQWWNAPVLVYGKWSNQPAHIVPFFTSIMDETQMTKARAAASRDWSKRPLEVLFVGRLSEAKNVDIILRALADIGPEGEKLSLRIIGDGPMRKTLQAFVNSLGLARRVIFEGAVAQSNVLNFYDRAHVLVLASQTEGWPKVIAEAMAFGLVCIGSNRGLVPQMLGEGKGLTVEPRDIDGLTKALVHIIRNPQDAAQISHRAAFWARQFTLERLREALRTELESRWGVKLRSTEGNNEAIKCTELVPRVNPSFPSVQKSLSFP